MSETTRRYCISVIYLESINIIKSRAKLMGIYPIDKMLVSCNSNFVNINLSKFFGSVDNAAKVLCEQINNRYQVYFSRDNNSKSNEEINKRTKWERWESKEEKQRTSPKIKERKIIKETKYIDSSSPAKIYTGFQVANLIIKSFIQECHTISKMVDEKINKENFEMNFNYIYWACRDILDINIQYVNEFEIPIPSYIAYYMVNYYFIIYNLPKDFIINGENKKLELFKTFWKFVSMASEVTNPYTGTRINYNQIFGCDLSIDLLLLYLPRVLCAIVLEYVDCSENIMLSRVLKMCDLVLL